MAMARRYLKAMKELRSGVSHEQPPPRAPCSRTDLDARRRSMRHPRCHAFIDEPPLAEAIEAEFRGKGRIALGDQLGHAPAGSGDRLEAAGAPAAVDEAAVERRLGQDGRAVA